MSAWDRYTGDNVSQIPIVFRPARLPPPESIPPRQWLYGTQLVRSFVSVLVAPGGTGKSLYAMAVGVIIASTVELFGEHVFQQANVALLNLEDPMEELERRLAAFIMRNKIPRDKVDGRFFMHSGEERMIKIASWAADGSDIVYPDEDALVAEIRRLNIGVLIVDPFAESHDLEENSNPQMVQASRAWRRVARMTNCAILLVHHVRKGAVLDIDAARGAKALTDSARVGMLMSSMDKAAAEELGIAEDDRWQFVRLDDAKANMAPKASAARWFRLEMVELGNGTTLYPNGDNVAAMTRWKPPSLFEELSIAQCNEALDAIANGPEKGILYAAHRRGRSNNRWAGDVLVDMFDVSTQHAAAMLKIWLKNGALYETSYRDTGEGKHRSGVAVDDGKRPGNRP